MSNDDKKNKKKINMNKVLTYRPNVSKGLTLEHLFSLC